MEVMDNGSGIAPEDYESIGMSPPLYRISNSLIVNSAETLHVKTCFLFRPDLRPYVWLSWRGPFFAMCAVRERQRHHRDINSGTDGYHSHFR